MADTQDSPAWAKAQLIQEIRTKFGVTLHSNMDIKTIAEQWAKAKKAECYPAITAAIDTAGFVASAQQAAVAIKTDAMIIKNAAVQVCTLISSLNPLSPNPSYIGTELLALSTTAAEALETAAITVATDALIQLIEQVPTVDCDIVVPTITVPSLPTVPTLSAPNIPTIF